jgi:hypothetical protein
LGRSLLGAGALHDAEDELITFDRNDGRESDLLLLSYKCRNWRNARSLARNASLGRDEYPRHDIHLVEYSLSVQRAMNPVCIVQEVCYYGYNSGEGGKTVDTAFP